MNGGGLAVEIDPGLRLFVPVVRDENERLCHQLLVLADGSKTGVAYLSRDTFERARPGGQCLEMTARQVLADLSASGAARLVLDDGHSG